MDSILTAAAMALAKGDPLGALNRVALRNDGPSLALRGIAMAQLGDLARAKILLARAAKAFGPKQAVARARCVVAEAEIALVSRELSKSDRGLETARKTLQAHGDHTNAAYARHLEVRRLLLLGQLGEAEQALQELDPGTFPPPFRATYELVVAGIAMRRLHSHAARTALAKARDAAHRSYIPALTAEVERAEQMLNAPAARLTSGGKQRLITLEEVEALQTSSALIVDGCRYTIRSKDSILSLATRPVLFVLSRALAEAWPDEVPRDTLITRTFRLQQVDETHRARLRVEIGRLRKLLKSIAGISATKMGFLLQPHHADRIVVLEQPIEEKHAVLLAILADGEAWSSSALALALGNSQRTVQRALDSLAAKGKVQSFGHGRARRWTTPSLPGLTTVLLLPGPLPND